MSQIRNATPRAILNGIQDLSIRQPVAEPESLPQHLPHVFIFAERGSTQPQLVVGGSLTKTYGSNTFDYRKKFANHQTVLVNTVNANGNVQLVQRLKPADASTARFRLSVEIQPAAVIPKFQRTVDGQWLRDTTGALVPELDGLGNPVTIIGTQYVWHVNYAGHAIAAFGEATPSADAFPRMGGDPTTVYPIFDFEVASHGEYGNRTGFRMTAPHALSSSPADISLGRSLKEFFYRFQFVERPEGLATPNIIQTIAGETSIDLVLGQDVLHPTFNTKLGIEDSLVSAYQDFEPSVGPAVIGPFGKMHVYRNNLDTVRDILRQSEADALIGATDPWIAMDYGDITLTGLMNVLNNIDYNGVPYESIRRIVVPDVTMVTFDSGQLTTIYASNGSDGDMSPANFDLLVRNEVENYGDLEFPVLDDAKYPQSVIYDTGFTYDTKVKLPLVLGKRKDMWVALGTHATGRFIDDPLNPGTKTYEPITTQMSISDESSAAIALRTALELQPESELYGTPVCRGIVVAHSGYLANSQYTGLLPLTLDIASKLSGYMGAGIGVWTNGKSPDLSPNNQVLTFKGVNNTYKKPGVYEKDWENGLIWAQSYDTRSIFYPAYQTAYPDDTSVLNSMITMIACVELEKVCQRVWRDLTGNTTLTNDQFVERSNELITARTQGRFDNRFVIIPETFYTEADLQRGYSWSCRVNIYANNMKTVGSFTVVANRMEDLAA